MIVTGTVRTSLPRSSPGTTLSSDVLVPDSPSLLVISVTSSLSLGPSAVEMDGWKANPPKVTAGDVTAVLSCPFAGSVEMSSSAPFPVAPLPKVHAPAVVADDDDDDATVSPPPPPDGVAPNMNPPNAAGLLVSSPDDDGDVKPKDVDPPNENPDPDIDPIDPWPPSPPPPPSVRAPPDHGDDDEGTEL